MFFLLYLIPRHGTTVLGRLLESPLEAMPSAELLGLGRPLSGLVLESSL